MHNQLFNHFGGGLRALQRPSPAATRQPALGRSLNDRVESWGQGCKAVLEAPPSRVSGTHQANGQGGVQDVYALQPVSNLHGTPVGPGGTRPRQTDLLGEVPSSLLQVGGGLGPPRGWWLWDPGTSVQEKAAGAGVCPSPWCLEGGRGTRKCGGQRGG